VVLALVSLHSLSLEHACNSGIPADNSLINQTLEWH